jgi:hypothetical protein
VASLCAGTSPGAEAAAGAEVVEVEAVRAEGVAAEEEEGVVVEAARAAAGEFCWSGVWWQGRCRCLGMFRL